MDRATRVPTHSPGNSLVEILQIQLSFKQGRCASFVALWSGDPRIVHCLANTCRYFRDLPRIEWQCCAMFHWDITEFFTGLVPDMGTMDRGDRWIWRTRFF